MTIQPMALALLLLGACQASSSLSAPGSAAADFDVEVARPPFTAIEVQWKERLPTRFVYRELFGDYRATWAGLESLRAALARSGVRAAGPAFCLFYDDPGSVPVERLRARLCIPVEPDAQLPATWSSDTLPGGTVAYTWIAAERGVVPQSYPAIYRHLEANGWAEDGPLREILLESSYNGTPLTEVQVPWRVAAR